MKNEQGPVNLTRPLEDVLADFARDIGADVRMVWSAYHLSRLLYLDVSKQVTDGCGSKRDSEAPQE
jgi:hypothetical protein